MSILTPSGLLQIAFPAPFYRNKVGGRIFADGGSGKTVGFFDPRRKPGRFQCHESRELHHLPGCHLVPGISPTIDNRTTAATTT